MKFGFNQPTVVSEKKMFENVDIHTYIPHIHTYGRQRPTYTHL